MTHVTCRLTARNRDQLRSPTLGNRVWATFTFIRLRSRNRSALIAALNDKSLFWCFWELQVCTLQHYITARFLTTACHQSCKIMSHSSGTSVYTWAYRIISCESGRIFGQGHLPRCRVRYWKGTDVNASKEWQLRTRNANWFQIRRSRRRHNDVTIYQDVLLLTYYAADVVVVVVVVWFVMAIAWCLAACRVNLSQRITALRCPTDLQSSRTRRIPFIYGRPV